MLRNLPEGLNSYLRERGGNLSSGERQLLSVARVAARKPKAILCEKPMAEDIGHAADMITACERNNVKLAVGHQRRFLPSYVETRNLIEKGAIGKVQMIRSISGSGLLNWASHLFDMFRYLLGDDDCDWGWIVNCGLSVRGVRYSLGFHRIDEQCRFPIPTALLCNSR